MITNKTHEEKTLELLLRALEFYKTIYGSLTAEDKEILDEQIGALRANLYGEEEGWRSKEAKALYDARQKEKMDALLKEIMKMVEIVPLVNRNDI